MTKLLCVHFSHLKVMGSKYFTLENSKTEDKPYFLTTRAKRIIDF